MAGRARTWSVGGVALLLGLGIGWFVRGEHDARSLEVERVRVADAAREPSATFELELHSRSDEYPGQSTVDLLGGRYGHVVRDGQVLNRGSHLDFDHYESGSFTAGIQGGEDGQVVDLGSHVELEAEFGGPPLLVLRWRDGALFAQGSVFDVPPGMEPDPKVVQAHDWVSKNLDLTGVAGKRKPHKSAQVKPGHVYFVRIVERDGTLVTMALVHVVEYDVGKRVRIRVAQL